MSNINALNSNIDLTVHIFDGFYKFQQAVPSQEYDAVHSYFQSVFAIPAQASNFTTTLFRIASASGIPPMQLLQSIQGMTKPQITLNFAFYLNTFQSPSTMLGIQTTITPNYYVAHNIKQ